MKNKIFWYTKTQGKSPDRNDDFVYAVNISNTRALGVVGDFISDSLKGDSQGCQNAIENYIEKMISEWLYKLPDGNEIVKETADQINLWMKKCAHCESKTTLVVVLYEMFDNERKLYYTILGDSGLALIKKNRIQYINKGDASGTRYASGFLPLKTNFEIEICNTEPSDFVFAYTDGFWENTSYKDGEKTILENFKQKHLKKIGETIFSKSTKKDDMSILIFWEEPMNEDLNKDIEKEISRLNQKFDTFRRDFEQFINKPSPVERFIEQKWEEFLPVQKKFVRDEDIRKSEEHLTEIIDRGICNLDRKIDNLDRKIDNLEKRINNLERKKERQPVSDSHDSSIAIPKTGDFENDRLPPDFEEQINKYCPSDDFLGSLNMNADSFKEQIKELYNKLTNDRDKPFGVSVGQPPPSYIDIKKEDLKDVIKSYLKYNDIIPIYHMCDIWLDKIEEKTDHRYGKKIEELRVHWELLYEREKSCTNQNIDSAVSNNEIKKLETDTPSNGEIETESAYNNSRMFPPFLYSSNKVYIIIGMLFVMLVVIVTTTYYFNHDISKFFSERLKTNSNTSNNIRTENSDKFKINVSNNIWKISGNSFTIPLPQYLTTGFKKDRIKKDGYNGYTLEQLREFLISEIKEKKFDDDQIKELYHLKINKESLFKEGSLDAYKSPDKTLNDSDVPDYMRDYYLESKNLNQLLKLMDEENTFVKEVECFKKALEKERKHIEKIYKPDTKVELTIMPINCNTLDKSVKIIAEDWMKKSNVDVKRIFQLWLQYKIGATPLDGKAGGETKKTFMQKYEKYEKREQIYINILREWRVE
ncbi:MAG: SpoIIE family protein phosphatase [Desulfobacterales bacterium]|nr:SpoIIE family protein phosphatase [Desulfobacterales bacterium]